MYLLMQYTVHSAFSIEAIIVCHVVIYAVEEGKGWFIEALKMEPKQPKRCREHSVTRRFVQ